MRSHPLLALVLLAVSAASGCGSSKEGCSEAEVPASARCATVYSCCTETECRYVVEPGDEEFECGGLVCDDVVAEVRAYCRGS